MHLPVLGLLSATAAAYHVISMEARAVGNAAVQRQVDIFPYADPPLVTVGDRVYDLVRSFLPSFLPLFLSSFILLHSLVYLFPSFKGA